MTREDDPYRAPPPVYEPRRLSAVGILGTLFVSVIAGGICFFATCVASVVVLDKSNMIVPGTVIFIVSAVGGIAGAVFIAKRMSAPDVSSRNEDTE